MSTLPSTNSRTNNRPLARGQIGDTGNPNKGRVSRFRRILLDTVSDRDMYDLVGTLVERGKNGDVGAIKELLDRMLGEPAAASNTGPALNLSCVLETIATDQGHRADPARDHTGRPKRVSQE